MPPGRDLSYLVAAADAVLAGAKYPDAALFLQGRGAAVGPQGHLVTLDREVDASYCFPSIEALDPRGIDIHRTTMYKTATYGHQ